MTFLTKWTASAIIVLALIVYTTEGMEGLAESSKDTRPKTGQFKRLERQTESQQIRCNDAHYTLKYLHLTNPMYFIYPQQVEILHRKINYKYPEWARKMLVTAFNVAADDDTEMDVPWLMYLYDKRIEAHVPRTEFLPVLRTAHYGMYKVLLCTMLEKDCTMFGPATKGERKFAAYVGDIKRSKQTNNDFKRNSDAVLELLAKHWPDLLHNNGLGRGQNEAGASGATIPLSIRPLTEEHFTKDLLYLNGVFENGEATALLTDFGVFEGGDQLAGYLKVKVNEMKSAIRPFRQHVLSLLDFHEHVLRAFKSIMLRVFYYFLVKLKETEKDHRKEHIGQFLTPFNDWCEFLRLPKDKDDNGFFVRYLPGSYANNKLWTGIIPGLQYMVISALRDNDNMSKVPLDNHTAESLRKINIDESRILLTAQKHEVTLDPRFEASKNLLKEEIRPIVMCAETLVAFMKKLFDRIDFRVIQSLVKLRTSKDFKRLQEYEQQYDADVFSREDKSLSIQVCGTETIRYTV